jgi:small basic protein (TIGR04137 family)
MILILASNQQELLPESVDKILVNLISNHYNFNLMSRHPSFKPPGGLSKNRNVLKRFERVELLRKRGQWKEGDRVVSLVKTKPED